MVEVLMLSGFGSCKAGTAQVVTEADAHVASSCGLVVPIARPAPPVRAAKAEIEAIYCNDGEVPSGDGRVCCREWR